MAGCAVLVVPAVGNAGKRSDIDSEDLIYSIPEPEAGKCASDPMRWSWLPENPITAFKVMARYFNVCFCAARGDAECGSS